MIEALMMNTEFKQRSDIHWARKIWHMVGVFTIFVIWSLASETASQVIFLLAFLLFVPLDIIRLFQPKLNEILTHAFRPIMRQSEVHRLAGTTYLITGVYIVTYFFPRPVASMTLLFLAFADPLASLVGIKYGKDKIFGHKSIQGFMAAYFVCAIISILFLSYYSQPIGRSIVFSLLAGLVGAVAEIIPIGKLDDNLSLPVLSAIGLWALTILFGVF